MNDEIEPSIDKNTNNQSSAASKKPATPEQRREVKEELTAPDDNASDLQIKGLKAVLKKLKAADPSKVEMIDKLSVTTKAFTEISKEDCEKLIQKINKTLEGISTDENN